MPARPRISEKATLRPSETSEPHQAVLELVRLERGFALLEQDHTLLELQGPPMEAGDGAADVLGNGHERP
jgi:hypothetical protein